MISTYRLLSSWKVSSIYSQRSLAKTKAKADKVAKKGDAATMFSQQDPMGLESLDCTLAKEAMNFIPPRYFSSSDIDMTRVLRPIRGPNSSPT